MVKNLVIVESPAKAKTINKFLGKGFVVEASMGHVRDLPKRKLGIDVDNDFEPEYATIRGRGKLLAKLRKLAKKSETVYLAPDLDREGEAIAWHLISALNIAPEKCKRITFNEITKKAITKALDEAGDINMDKVNAQQTRRLLDRIVGYKISPILWKKIARGLSAGRVQSVAVRLVVLREKEIAAFVSEEYWTISAHLTATDGTNSKQIYNITSQLVSIDGENIKNSAKKAPKIIATEDEAKSECERLTPLPYVITKVEKRKRKDNPPPPLTTSTLQQRASSQCYFSAKKTMMVAQQLYEGISLGAMGNVGLITYMRTDSVRLSDDAIAAIKEYVTEEFGPEYFPEKLNNHKAKKSAQEAHEAIRPTDISRHPDNIKKHLSTDQYKLYSLIWKRAVISQMTPSQIHNTTVDISCDNAVFKARGREILFPGYLALESNDDKEGLEILPPLEEGQTLGLKKILPEQHFTSPPPRYTEASLVRTMEAEGIGRPSTYAPTLTTIQDRGYVNRKERKFHASKLGILVTELLEEHFPQIVDYKFTSEMEGKLDSIEEGSTEWVKFLHSFYDPFIKTVDTATEEMKDFKKEGEVTDEKCAICDKPMVIKWSKNGQFMGCSGFPDCRSTKPMPGEEEDDDESSKADLSPCEKCGKPMMLKHGRFGKFVSCSAYPECSNTRAMSTGIKCPQENCAGELVARRSKKGRPFYGCSRYPDCDFITNRINEFKKEEEEAKETESEKE